MRLTKFLLSLAVTLSLLLHSAGADGFHSTGSGPLKNGRNEIFLQEALSGVVVFATRPRILSRRDFGLILGPLFAVFTRPLSAGQPERPNRDRDREILKAFFAGPWTDFVNAPSQEARQEARRKLDAEAQVIDITLGFGTEMINAVAAIENLASRNFSEPEKQAWIAFNEQVLHWQLGLFVYVYHDASRQTVESCVYEILPPERSVKVDGRPIALIDGRRIDSSRTPSRHARSLSGEAIILDQAAERALALSYDTYLFGFGGPWAVLNPLRNFLSGLSKEELVGSLRRIALREQLGCQLYALRGVHYAPSDQFGIPVHRWEKFGPGAQQEIGIGVASLLYALSSASSSETPDERERQMLAMDMIMQVVQKDEGDPSYWVARYALFRITHLGEPITNIHDSMDFKKKGLPKHFEKDFLGSSAYWSQYARLYLLNDFRGMPGDPVQFPPEFNKPPKAGGVPPAAPAVPLASPSSYRYLHLRAS